jgi:hypothetical protein
VCRWISGEGLVGQSGSHGERSSKETVEGSSIKLSRGNDYF